LKVCAVIVTYGERFHLLKQVIDACFREGVDKVIVVDNASVENSRKQLKEYESKNKDKLKVIYLDENTGSAGGYKRGLQEAYNDSKCEFIWLLDDDNKPEKESLSYLLSNWKNYKIEDKTKTLALLSNRIDRTKFIEAVQCNNPNIILGRKNKYLGFHIYDLFDKLLNRFLNKKKIKYKDDIEIFPVPIAPYGGLFIHKNMLEEIGYPNSSFRLYADDSEFTYRITLAKGKILLILKSLIIDIDEDWTKTKKQSRMENFVDHIEDKDDAFQKVYYTVRNLNYMEKKYFTNNKCIYFINKMIFYFIFSLVIIKKTRSVNKLRKIINYFLAATKDSVKIHD
jgi:GT2 family glycosyltransferase